MTPAAVAGAPNATVAALSKRWLPSAVQRSHLLCYFPCLSLFANLSAALVFALFLTISLLPALVRTRCLSLSLSLPHRYGTHLSLFCLYLLLSILISLSVCCCHILTRGSYLAN